MAARPYSRQFKVCLIGDGYVGKTSMRRRYLGRVFKASYIATIGVDFAQKSVTVDGSQALLVIWDIAGQPLWQGLRKRYYEGASGIVLVYSVVERASFDNASKWLVEAHGFMQRLPPLVIVGNKIDLRPTAPPEQIVAREEGEAFTRKFSESMNAEAVFIETSAATGEMIDEAFAALTNLMIEAAGRRMPGYVQKSRAGQLSSTSAPQSTLATNPPSESVVSSSVAAQAGPSVALKQPPSTAMPSATASTPSGAPWAERQEASTQTRGVGSEPTASGAKIIHGRQFTERPPPPPSSSYPSPTVTTEGHAEAAPAEVVGAVTEGVPEVDAFLSFMTDLTMLEDSQIKESIAELLSLHRELKKTESALATTSSSLDADLLNFRNAVHVKRMMYEALQQQLRLLRDEWAQAYEEYQKTDRRKKTETEERTRQIDDLKKRIGRAKESTEKRARDLQNKDATR